MKSKLGPRWLALGAAVVMLAGCDGAQSRMDQFGELVDEVWQQVSTDVLGQEPADPLTSAPLEARALAGVRVAAVEVAPVSLDEALSTQSFFVVGSIIAQPRVDMTEAVVESEELDDSAVFVETAAVEEVAPEVAEDAPDTASRSRSVDRPESLEMIEPGAGAPPPPVPLPSPVVQAPQVVAPSEIQRRVQVAPRALEEAVRSAEKPVSKESLRKARQLARQSKTSTSQTAQSVGDEVVRRSKDEAAPVPKALSVRKQLKVQEALSARERAYSKLEEMGLSGVVTPEEGGQMTITIGIEPTKFIDGKVVDPTTVEAMRARFSRRKGRPQDECAGNPTQRQMRDDPVLATECVVKALQETGDYEFVEKDYVFTAQLLKRSKSKQPTVVSDTPNDPLYGLQWHFKENGTGSGQSAGGAGFENFWTRTKSHGSRSVTVAVVDTGIQMNHPDIAGSANLAVGFDMVSDPVMGNDGDGRDTNPHDPGDKCDPSDPTVSDTFHGTHVAGTIGVAATNNANGIAGGAWDVTIVPVRALGRCGGRLSDINDAIRWAAATVPARDAQGNEVWNANPADIINLSIGLFEPCPASMQAAIDDAVEAGSIVVTAAGNARIDTKYFAPGGCRNVISVAASDARGVLTPYSNFGEDVDIMAPGGDMTRDDDGDGRPDGVLSTKFSTDCYDPAKPGVQVEQCFYAYENGTSMAAPHVSAALALIKSRFPDAVPSELTERLLASSSARSANQCSGKCTAYPGTTPIPGQEGMCYRPCGGSMLNLSNASLQ